jgi:general secretion pathway protein N
MRRWSLVALGAGAYAAALIALAPATVLDVALARASAGRFRLVEAQGTVWSGKGFVEVRDARSRRAVAKRVDWRVIPAPLLRGTLHVELTTVDSPAPITIAATPSRVEISNAALTLPAAVLALAMPKLAAFELTGDIGLQVARLTLTADEVVGTGHAQWHAAGSSLTKLSPIGSYALDFEPEGSGLRATLRTLDGPVALQGAGSWSARSGPALRVTAEVAITHRQALAPVLRLVALERAPGRYDFELQ